MLAELRSEIKRLIVTELNLKGRDPETIEDDAPLFGGGLGLDSLDALQLAMSIEEKLGVRIPEGDEARAIFRSVRRHRGLRRQGAWRVSSGPLGDRPGARHAAGRGRRGDLGAARAAATGRSDRSRCSTTQGSARASPPRWTASICPQGPRRGRGWSRTSAMARRGRERGDAHGATRPCGELRVGLVVGSTTGGMFETERLLAQPARRARVPRGPRRACSRTRSRATGDRLDERLGPVRARPHALERLLERRQRHRGRGRVAALRRGRRRRRRRERRALPPDAQRASTRSRALDPEPCRPFDRRRRGTNLGEGAGFLVLERAETARARGATPVAELAGWAVGSEAHHITNPAPDGAVVASLIARALARARPRARATSTT